MGVEKEVLKEGDGENFPKKGDKLKMVGLGAFGELLHPMESSYDRGTPFEFNIGRGEVIKGWDEGVIQMSLGEKSKLLISSDYGYGSQGAGGVIPPNADLVFEVELLAIGGLEVGGGGCCVIS
eukprot:scaffold2214_cov139-Cylindrotheca_fusiformis.AAC.21